MIEDNKNYIKEKITIQILYMKDRDVNTITIDNEEDSILIVEFKFDCLVISEKNLDVENLLFVVPIKNLISLSSIK